MYQSDPHRSQTSGHVENKRRERTRRNKKPEYRELYKTLLHMLRDARLISSTPQTHVKSKQI